MKLFTQRYLNPSALNLSLRLQPNDWVFHMKEECHGVIERLTERDAHLLGFIYHVRLTDGRLVPSIRIQLTPMIVSLLEVIAEASS
jgi:hypothetical protein